MSTGFEKPELDGKTVMHTVAETDGNEIHQAPDSPATHRAEEVQEPVVQQPTVHHISQDPVGLPADSLVDLPKPPPKSVDR
jgi:hypothetical protein